MSDCRQGLEECKYTFHQVMEVRDGDTVVDRTVYDMLQPTDYVSAMAMKYLALQRTAESGVEAFVKFLEMGGDAERVLKDI